MLNTFMINSPTILSDRQEAIYDIVAEIYYLLGNYLKKSSLITPSPSGFKNEDFLPDDLLCLQI